MEASKLKQIVSDVVCAYIELGDFLRMAALPNWFTADLNLSQLKAVMLLEHHSALTVSELARLLGLGNPAASILVQQLVEQSLAERSEDPQDRRRSIVRLTQDGTLLIASRREHLQASLLDWLSQLGEEDLAGLQHGLVNLVKIVRAQQEKDG